jgi:hypothetical protein
MNMETTIAAASPRDFALQILAEGASSPSLRTTVEQRHAMAAQLRAERPTSVDGYAARVGLRVEAIEGLPMAQPVALVGTTLLVTGGRDRDAHVLFGVAGHLLTRAGIESNPADVWTLAAELASPAALFTQDA